jgi:hypothetical protein
MWENILHSELVRFVSLVWISVETMNQIALEAQRQAGLVVLGLTDAIGGDARKGGELCLA